MIREMSLHQISSDISQEYARFGETQTNSLRGSCGSCSILAEAPLVPGDSQICTGEPGYLENLGMCTRLPGPTRFLRVISGARKHWKLWLGVHVCAHVYLQKYTICISSMLVLFK